MCVAWQAQQGPVRQGAREPRGHVPVAGARVLPRPGGLAQEGRRHRRQGPGQVRLLLGVQHREYDDTRTLVKSIMLIV